MENKQLDPRIESQLQSTLRSVSVIIVAFTVTLGTFIGLGFLVISEPKIGELAPLWKGAVISIVGLIVAVLAILYRRRSQSADRIDDVFHESGLAGLIGQLAKSAILSGALAESVGLIGLAGGIMVKDPWVTLRLCGVGVIVAIMSYPRRSAWHRAVDYYSSDEAGRASGPEIKEMKGIY